MTWLDLPRVPEPEVMDNSAEVDAYSSAAAQVHLSKIDDTFVERAMELIGGASLRHSGRLLDIGTGPGEIVFKMARRLPVWHFVGVDRSSNMVRQALAGRDRAGLGAPGTLTARVEFAVADGNRLPFADAAFDLVLCNSMLHHLGDPTRLLAEIARVAKPDGAILLRDLRRPSRLSFPAHVRWHGRHYAGLMYKLYRDSVRAAYTLAELSEMLNASPLTGARVFTYRRTHLGIERAAR